MTQLLNWVNRVHHDGSEVYLSNPLPTLNETIQIRLRVPRAANLTTVYLRAILDGEFSLFQMKISATVGASQIWETDFKVEQLQIDYCFALVNDQHLYFYHNAGVSEADIPDYYMFKLVANYTAPLWVRDSVFYQIFPDRFANGDPTTTVQNNEYELGHFKTTQREWGDAPYHWHEGGNLDFFGGDLAGITQKLDYLETLGITGIYLCPIFTSKTNHRYDMLDYFNVDEHLGGNSALAELRIATQERTMQLMLDITTNHCGVIHHWVEEATADSDCEAAEYFYRDEDSGDFARWLGVSLLVKLNYQSEKLRDMMYRSKQAVMRHWLRPPYAIDGWRIDVANMTGNFRDSQIDHEVWRELRTATKSERDDAYLLGEYFQDGTPHLQGDELDGGMNYQGFNIPMRRWLGEKPKLRGREIDISQPRLTTSALVQQWQNFMFAIPYPIALQQFNQLDSHDISRILHVTDGDKALVKLGVALMIGFPGVPCFYYGSEIGLAGGDDPDNRGCMPWAEDDWDTDLLDYHQNLIAIRKNSHALKHGGFQVLLAEGDCVAFLRESAEEMLIVIGYRGDEILRNTEIEVKHIGLADGALLRDLISGEIVSVTAGKIKFPQLAHGQAMILSS